MNYKAIKGFFDGLRPEPILLCSEWAEQYRYLSSVASAEAGLYSFEKTPYLREIADHLSSFNPCQRVVFMKSSQTGGTELGLNWIGYIIDNAPSSILLIEPTGAMVESLSKDRIQPMINECPRLKEKVAGQSSKNSSNTILSKSFPGGVLNMTGSESASALASRPVRYVFADECDRYPLDVEGEGSAIGLAEARTRTFANRKIFLVSTPTVEGASIIESEFLKTDQRRFFVPCPHCGVFQHLKFSQLRYEKSRIEDTTRYECEGCNQLIEERYKPFMIGSGEWRATVPQNKNSKVVGFHINTLYSPLGWHSWADMVRDYEAALLDEKAMITFVNTQLGETVKVQSDAPDWQNLFNRREAYNIGSVPIDVAFLTAGIDVQKDRLEMQVIGWCKGKQNYSIDYIVLNGLTSEGAVWEELRNKLGSVYNREDGAQLPIMLTCIDTGYNTKFVYDFVSRFDPQRIRAIKGQDKQKVVISNPQQVHTNSEGKRVGGVQLWNIGVSLLKQEFYGWLRLHFNEDGTYPNGYVHFPQYAENYFKGLTAEYLERKIVRGYAEYQWVKRYDRNEPLDTWIYARAAATMLQIDIMQEKDFEKIYHLHPRPIQEYSANNQQIVKKKRESWLNG